MLTKTEISRAKPKATRYSMSDIRGLHIEIMPSGRKFWRLRYTREGKLSWHTIGEFPAVSVDEARERTRALQQRLKDGLPLVEKNEPEKGATFAEVAAAWLEANDKRDVVESTKRCARRELTTYALPVIGDMEMNKITPQDVLNILLDLADEGKSSIVVRVKGFISQVFRYAALRGLAQYDPVVMLRGAIQLPPKKHHRSLSDPKDVADLLRAINSISSKRIRLALSFLAYSFCRPGEMYRAEWHEIDFERREWRLPQEKMKKRRPHIVPLSSQLVDILEAMRPFKRNGSWIFGRPVGSDGETRACGRMMLRRNLNDIGFGDKITPHGFRSMASTILNENGFNSDWIERQLAHVERNRVRAAYNYADFLDDRRVMLQWYRDFLDTLRGEPLNLEG